MDAARRPGGQIVNFDDERDEDEKIGAAPAGKAKKPAKTKEPAPPKAKKGKKDAAGDADGEGKKKKSAAGLVILICLLITAGLFLYLSLTRDWGGVRTTVLDTVNKLDPDYRSVEEKLAQYNMDQALLEAGQKALADAQKKLEEQKKALDAERVEIDDLRVFTLPLYRRGLPDEKIAELKALGKIYSVMEAESAADIMARLYDVSHMAAIVYYMDKGAAAAVLDAMNHDLAARVTTDLLRY